MDQKQFEEIEAYVLDRLDEAERHRFEKRLRVDAELAKEVESMRESVLSIELEGMQRTIESIQDEHTEQVLYIEKTEPNRIRPQVWWALAAGLALLVASVIWLTDDTNPRYELYSTHFFPDPGLPVAMGTTDAYAFTDAMVDYKNEAYQKAVAKWSDLLEDGDENDTLRYYIGCAYMNLHDHEQAIAYLSPLASDKSSPLFEKAQWYLALNYLYVDRIDALKRLDLDENEYYGDRIKELITKLDQL
ncbi:MAG: hypothetical protein HKN79_05405 [Flavobacteriales bacterium]|nr:hypothetical protein [Flavobacteriales bacterium]